MTTGLIIALGLDDFIADFILQESKAQVVAFLATEANIAHVPAIAARSGIERYRVFFIKNIFRTSETIEEFFTALDWIKTQGDVSDLYVDATNSITVVEMATYVSASFADLHRELIQTGISLKLVYVHSQYERTASGAFVEVRGSQKLVQLERPVDSLSFVLAREGVRSFNSGRYDQAYDDFEQLALDTTGDKSLLYSGLSSLSIALNYWDKMDFAAASASLNEATRRLAAARNFTAAMQLSNKITEHALALEKLLRLEPVAVLLDLIANAERREKEGRFDDAVARLYAAIERMVSFRLSEHGIETSNPNYANLTPQIITTFKASCGGDLPAELELKKAVSLIALLTDPLGELIRKMGLKTIIGLAGIRNRSVLAHGITPIPSEHFKNFKSKLFTPFWESFSEASQISAADIDEHKFATIPAQRDILCRDSVAADEMVVRKTTAMLH